MPPSGGIPLQIVPAGLRNVLGYLGSVARASAMLKVPFDPGTRSGCRLEGG
jgi:hypothetical protein